MLTRFQPDEPDQQIIFVPDNRSTGSITTWAVEGIRRELGPICNTGPFSITAEIGKDGSPVELGYCDTLLVKRRRVVVTLTFAGDKNRVLVVMMP